MTRPGPRRKRSVVQPPPHGQSQVTVEEVRRGDIVFELSRTHIRCTRCDATLATGGDRARAQRFLEAHTHPVRRPPSPPAAELGARARLIADLELLGEDELEVLAEVSNGLVRGRGVYGELRIDADQRDHEREALDELRDGLAYAAIAVVKRRRQRAAAAEVPRG